VVIGNEMFFDAFEVYLKEQTKYELDRDLKPQLNRITAEVFRAVKERMMMTKAHEYRSFQLFGFDFMIDADFKVFLIEINATPASAEHLLENMVKDLVEVVIDPLYPPAKKPSRENLFELIYDPNARSSS